jgi:NAD(P)H dehydrogenase (quinone)
MILITGATGSIGRHLVHRLQQDGVPFRALVRDRDRGLSLGCDLSVGDFDDPASIAEAMRGVDSLLLNGAGALPASGEQPMVRQQRAVIEAARAAGVSRVVKVSVWGAREGGLLALGAHWQIEQSLKSSGLEWSLLRPSGFMQNFLTGAGAFSEDGDLVGAQGESRVSYVDCYDIAACAAELLTSGPGGRGAGRAYTLTGPEALTQAEIAGQLSAALGRTVRYVDLTSAGFAARLRAQGLPPQFADDVVTLWDEVATGSQSAITPDVAELTGRPPRTFAAFLAAHQHAPR